jgi:hypothetical protein
MTTPPAGAAKPEAVGSDIDSEGAGSPVKIALILAAKGGASGAQLVIGLVFLSVVAVVSALVSGNTSPVRPDGQVGISRLC